VSRVTLVSYDDEPPLGGQGVEVAGMRAALRARGHLVSTIAGRGDHALRYPRISGRAPLDFSVHVNRHPGLITATHPDVVHVLGGPGGVLMLRRLDAALVYTANHTYRMAHGRSLKAALSPLEARAYRRAARVLAISASTALAVRALGVRRERIEVLPPGIDVPAGPPAARDGLRLMFAGRWEREKGVLAAVTAMREVIGLRPAVTGVVVGAGSLAAEVRALAAGVPGLDVAGRVDEVRLRGEYARASVVLVPSRYEGLGLVALEGQAQGAVVVGYDVEGLRDAVADRRLLVPPGDRDALARACVGLLDDGARLSEAAAAGREWVRATHSWDRVGTRLGEVYDAVRSA
jgi:glycosyltransferase involved in cell wall biosynthesis